MSTAQFTNQVPANEEPTHCRMCETVLPPAAQKCPRCGMPVRRVQSDPTEVRTHDVILSVLMAVMAILGTVPMTYPVLKRLGTLALSPDMAIELVLAGIWNGVILGIPVVQMARRWYTRVRKGNFHHAWVFRDYWFLQAMALSPVWCCLGYSVLTRDYYWFIALMGR